MATQGIGVCADDTAICVTILYLIYCPELAYRPFGACRSAHTDQRLNCFGRQHHKPSMWCLWWPRPHTSKCLPAALRVILPKIYYLSRLLTIYLTIMNVSTVLQSNLFGNAAVQFGQCRSPVFRENVEATDTSQYTEVVTWKMICGFLRQLWSLISTRTCPRNDDSYITMISQLSTVAAVFDDYVVIST